MAEATYGAYCEQQHGFDEYGCSGMMSQMFMEGDGSSWTQLEDLMSNVNAMGTSEEWSQLEQMMGHVNGDGEINQCFEEDCFVTSDDGPGLEAYIPSDALDNSTEPCQEQFAAVEPTKIRRGPFFMFRRAPFYGQRFVRGRGAVEERPRKRHLCWSLVCVVLAFILISWRRDSLPLRGGAGASSPAPQTCGRHPTLLTRAVAIAGLASRILLGAEWAGFGTHYCGPLNGADFVLRPVDVLDAMCAQHDYCIEKSRYLVGARARELYPVGVVDEDDFQRCGIPLQSHRNPNYGSRIKACDEEFLMSLEVGFQCQGDSDMPKGPWCSSSRLAGKKPCHEYEDSWRYPFCAAAATFARRYHRWKIRNGCAAAGGPPLPPAAAPAAEAAAAPAEVYKHMALMAAAAPQLSAALPPAAAEEEGAAAEAVGGEPEPAGPGRPAAAAAVEEVREDVAAAAAIEVGGVCAAHYRRPAADSDHAAAAADQDDSDGVSAAAAAEADEGRPAADSAAPAELAAAAAWPAAEIAAAAGSTEPIRVDPSESAAARPGAASAPGPDAQA